MHDVKVKRLDVKPDCRADFVVVGVVRHKFVFACEESDLIVVAFEN